MTHPRCPWLASIALLGSLMLTATSCERETRKFDALTGSMATAADRLASTDSEGPFHDNAWGMSEGKRLFTSYNCVGCHANGGGGMGPPLMDDRWIYGAQAGHIYRSIADGRPNGMPAFRGRIPDTQIWMLVAYVQSMSGQAPIDVMPGRADHMRSGTPENARRAETPKQTGPR